MDHSIPTPSSADPAPASKARRGGRVTDKRRQEIIRHCARLFLERGYENVTIDDIVNAVGGSKRTLYSAFGGKAGLFEIVIKDFCASVQRDLVPDINRAESLEQQLIAIGTKFLTRILDPKILEQHRLMVSMGKSFPSVAQMFYDAGPMTAYKIVADWIRRQQAMKTLKPSSDPMLLAELFLDMLTGRHQLARLMSVPAAGKPAAIRDTVAAAAALFLQGAQAPADRRRSER